jgi:hypothetical protein
MLGKPRLAPQRFHHREQLVLAMEAAVGIVACVLGAIQFFGGDTTCSGMPMRRKGAGLLHIAPRQAGRIGQHGKHPEPRTRCAVAARNAESTPPE